MRGDKQRVVTAFCAWLEREGWSVRREVNWVDVVAEREVRTLYAEAKGRTTEPGLDIKHRVRSTAAQDAPGH